MNVVVINKAAVYTFAFFVSILPAFSQTHCYDGDTKAELHPVVRPFANDVSLLSMAEVKALNPETQVVLEVVGYQSQLLKAKELQSGDSIFFYPKEIRLSDVQVGAEEYCEQVFKLPFWEWRGKMNHSYQLDQFKFFGIAIPLESDCPFRTLVMHNITLRDSSVSDTLEFMIGVDNDRDTFYYPQVITVKRGLLMDGSCSLEISDLYLREGYNLLIIPLTKMDIQRWVTQRKHAGEYYSILHQTNTFYRREYPELRLTIEYELRN